MKYLHELTAIVTFLLRDMGNEGTVGSTELGALRVGCL